MSTRKSGKIESSTTMVEKQISVQRDHYPVDKMAREKGGAFVPHIWGKVSSKYTSWCWFLSDLQQQHVIIVYGNGSLKRLYQLQVM
jgi:hypothetical protein